MELAFIGEVPFRQVLYPSLAAVAGGLAAWALTRARWSRRASIASEAAQERIDLQTESRDLRKSLHQLQSDNSNLSTFLLTLPDLARQLNSNVEKRRIPQILISFIEQLFDAEQILIFLASPDGRHLTYAAGKGLKEAGRGHAVVPFGKGRVGWVAWHQITMDENDFMQKSRVTRGASLDVESSSQFRTELCAPMVSKDQTLGVISIGGLRRRPKNEKNMLKMVADLGSIAIQNTLLFSQIQASANSDGLTGLANKRHFMSRLAEEIIKAEKDQKPLSLFIFDIDHFKTYNDTNGHLAGDEALRMTGRLLDGTVRQEDLTARYGGEEFVVLLPGTDKQGAAIAAEKIRRAVEEYEYPNGGAQPGGRVTISGGVATFPDDARSMQDLIRCADRGLYQGKRTGRNRVAVYETRHFSDETHDPDLQMARGVQEAG